MLLGMLTFTTRNTLDAGESKLATGGAVTASGSAVTSGAVGASGSSVATGGENAKGVSLLMKNAYPEINKLVGEYLKARLAIDKEKMELYVDDINYAGLDKLPEMTKDMESIELLDCYTIDGPEEKAVMVYARNKIKFKGIDTPASGIDGFYIRPDENGDMKIVLSPLADEIQKIIDEDIKRADVVSLLKDVNTELAREIKSDEKLADFFKKLQEKNESEGETQP